MPDTALTDPSESNPIPQKISLMEALGPLDTGSKRPAYLMLKTAFRQAIRKKLLEPNATLPPERDLAKLLNLSRMTIRRAMEGLVEEGLLLRRRGSGTFVANRAEKNFSKLTSFTEDMISRGRKPKSEWLEKTRSVASTDELLILGLSPGSHVYRLSRLRFADGKVIALEYTIVPANCLPSLEVIEGSLYRALEQVGNRPVRALQRLRAVLFTPEQAEKLRVRTGDAGLMIERRSSSANGRCCEYSKSWYRSDAYDVVAELNDAA
ncbi:MULTISPECIES: GntR family transcriptional regulator [Asticcacaulis]|uniref:GntR family transcriptional regulator n=1 Tax=Asticcacaulis TaxID=76890 RepID=UPI001FD8B4C6|nr:MULTISPECIES: GntR family transcriptional regulator [Asticcacaulis]MBP2161598.1 GntR family transcriptional regulator [Asticcacaulis solisilvae]MDR6802643.1 GntR family transcriptional regulator [Asticcacaulis sp. BE141]